ncbi:MAG: hypothetical protein HQL83_11975, partial [Magnetococcales bacterium]|nr:hypothetical protein [Magnetococcales bacterium]
MTLVYLPAAATRALILQAVPEYLNALDDAAFRPLVPYLPASHARALHPRQTLVEGIRGSGKSFWYTCLLDPVLRERLARQRDDFPIDPAMKIFPGFGEAVRPDDYPDRQSFAALMQKCSVGAIWRAILAHHLLDADQKPALPDWERRVRWIQENSEQTSRAFLQLEQRLEQKDEQRLILFDAIDRTSDHWRTMRRMARELLQSLLEFRSFRHLHIKVFIRPDLLSDPGITDFPDSSKLIGNKERLIWPPRDLYNLLWHLLGNAPDGEEFRNACQERFGLRWTQQKEFWRLPTPLQIDEERQKQVFHALTGPFMGRDRKRGMPHTWLPDHLGDANGQISPRSFLAAIRHAARHAESGSDPIPLPGESLRFGLQQASAVRVQEIKEDHPWVEPLFEPMAGQTVPMVGEEIEKLWQRHGSLERIKKGREEDTLRRLPRQLDLPGIRQELQEIGLF